MAFKRKKNKKVLGTVSIILIITLITIVLSAVMAKLGLQAEKTALVDGSLIVTFTSIKNFLSVEGFKYLFGNVILNFKMFEPLAIMIISIIAFGIFEVSGLLQAITNPLKNLTSKSLTMLVLLLSFMSSFLGEFSFAIMLPFAAILYYSLGKNAMVGVLTSFLGVTLGYGSGLLFNHDQILLGSLTQIAATMDVDKNYVFNSFSASIIMTVSMLIFVPVISLLIENYISPYFNKPAVVNNEREFSKKGLFYSLLAFIILILFGVYMIVPGLPYSGLLLDMSQDSYFDKLFSLQAPFREGLSLLILITISISSLIYGKISKNLESSTGITDSLAIGLQECGYLLMICFFGSIMISVFEWTGIGEWLVCKSVELLSMIPLSGILLIGIFFILIVLLTFFVPSVLTKWSLMSPIIVPLFMRANITPDFAQFIFQVADGVGKSISIFFPYFLITLGLMHKYNSDDMKIGMGSVIKKIMPVVLITAALWIVFFVIWYLAGFPVGISEYATL